MTTRMLDRWSLLRVGLGSEVAAIGACLLLLALPAEAQGLSTSWQHGHGSSTRLIVGSRLEPGGVQRLMAGVEIKLGEGWKTYWRQPGDSGGIPPYFNWSGSVNLASADVRYPAPERLKDPTGQSIGYKKGVVFPIELRPADPTRPIVLKLAVNFGICREICVPADAMFETTIAPGVVTVFQPELASALERVPRAGSQRREGDPELVRATAQLTGSSPSLIFEVKAPGGSASADLFVEPPDDVYVPMPSKVGDQVPGTIVFRIDLAQDVEIARLKGAVLKLTMTGTHGASEASWKVE